MCILLFAGKGGVGKTSVAAATALRCADFGSLTIVVSVFDNLALPRAMQR